MRGTMDHLGSTSDAEFLGNGDEIAQIPQIHPNAYYSGPLVKGDTRRAISSRLGAPASHDTADVFRFGPSNRSTTSVMP